MLYGILRSLLFLTDAEKAHNFTFGLLKNGSPVNAFVPDFRSMPADPVTIAGLNFKNRLGLAAGLDKNAVLLNVWAKLGFSHIEIGTVTPRPQAGNPKPRLFRLVNDRALINRMGFNNDSADAVARRLENRPAGMILGANIGKNKDTPAETAHEDYVLCLKKLHPFADYFTINVSSPNTPGLRNLQHKTELTRLLSEIHNENEKYTPVRPLFVKIAPDLSSEELEDILAAVTETNMNGLIATNTTVSRTGLTASEKEIEKTGAGGLSGAPLFMHSTEVLRQLSSGNLPVVGVGGIFNRSDAVEKLKAGAELIQIYTGLIYRGPELIKEILQRPLSDSVKQT